MADKNLQTSQQDLVVEEFSIMELEDRLELTDRCNGNCSCNPDPNTET